MHPGKIKDAVSCKTVQQKFRPKVNAPSKKIRCKIVQQKFCPKVNALVESMQNAPE